MVIQFRILFYLAAIPICLSAADWGDVVVDTTGSDWLRITFENSVYRAVIRENSGAVCGHEHAIRDWVMKSIKIFLTDLQRD